MKKFLVLIIIGAAGYFVYEYLFNKKPDLEVKADKVVSTSYSMDAEAPALAPANSACIQGSVKNVSDRIVTNIVLKYKLDGKPVEASVYSLEPGEEKSFSTPYVMVRNAGAPFYLEEMTYE